jgi:AcrR family transcriptional regulator
MATEADTQPTPRLPLNRERVLRAALALADKGGIGALSMRRLGQELGVEAMSLYNHAKGKDDILDGIIEIVLDEVDLPPDEADWKEALRRIAISAHEAFVRHPWACGLMLGRTSVSPPRMRWMEAVLRTLREAGFSADLTHHAYHALDSHITGFTLWQVSMPFDTREELVDLAEAFLQETSADEYPYVVEHAEQHMGPSAPEGKTEFEFGLDLILDGLERLRDAQEGGRTAS